MSQTTLVNGDVSHSAFVDHLVSYPLISSGIATYKSYPLGQETIAIAHKGYSRFVAPFLTHPFAQEKLKPRLSPYLNKADNFGDESLSTIDARFPVLKQDPKELQNQIWTYFSTPLSYADEGKKHVLSIYNKQLEKQGGAGYIASVRALFTTSLITSADALSAAATWVGQKESQIKAKADAKLNEKQ